MEDISDEFAIMYERAEKCMKEEFAAEQAIVIMTGKNEMYSFVAFQGYVSEHEPSKSRYKDFAKSKRGVYY